MRIFFAVILGFSLAIGIAYAKEGMSGYDYLWQAFQPVYRNCNFDKRGPEESPKCRKAINKYLNQSLHILMPEG